MFHFPRFPLHTYVFSMTVVRHSPDGVSPFGHSWINGCLPPSQDFSQAATSFIGIISQAIHLYTLILSTHWLRTIRIIVASEYIKLLFYVYCIATSLVVNEQPRNST